MKLKNDQMHQFEVSYLCVAYACCIWMCNYLWINAAVHFCHHIVTVQRICFIVLLLPSVLWRCWLGGRKGIWPVKNWLVGAGVVICLGRDADLHMAQLMPLPLTVSCSGKSRLVLPYWHRPTQVITDKGPLNRCCCCYWNGELLPVIVLTVKLDLPLPMTFLADRTIGRAYGTVCRLSVCL